VLDGHDDPVQFVLEHGTRNLPDGEGLLKIRDLLVDDGVTAVEGESDARTIVERTRRWAVAEWFVDEGLDKALLPQEYQPEPSTGFGVSRPELRSMLSKTERKGELANVYRPRPAVLARRPPQLRRPMGTRRLSRRRLA